MTMGRRRFLASMAGLGVAAAFGRWLPKKTPIEEWRRRVGTRTGGPQMWYMLRVSSEVPGTNAPEAELTELAVRSDECPGPGWVETPYEILNFRAPGEIAHKKIILT